MDKKNENINAETENKNENNENVEIVVADSPAKKILKWVAVAGAFVITNGLSFLLGRHSADSDDDDPNTPAE